MLAIRIARIAIAGCIVVTLAATQASAGSIRAGRLGLGDSVMLGAKQELRARGFGVVDAVVSRQFYRAPALVRYWRRQGRLPKDVVIHLGTNGTVNLTDCYHAVRAAGRRKVFLVNLKVPRSWRAEDNQRLHHCAKRFPNAYLIDWYRHSHDHPGWFAPDGYHLTGTGRIAYATLIKREVVRHERSARGNARARTVGGRSRTARPRVSVPRSLSVSTGVGGEIDAMPGTAAANGGYRRGPSPST